MRRRIVAGVLALALLGGCAANPGAAAVIDGRTVTHGEVAQAVDDLGPILASATAANVTTLLILAPVALDAAEAGGFGVSDDDARTFVVMNGYAAEDAVAAYSDPAMVVLRFAVLQSVLATEEQFAIVNDAVAAVGSADVRVNPRIGTWDPDALVVQALATPWIVGSAGS